jgi:putative ABC transport system ATP-binding protein
MHGSQALFVCRDLVKRRVGRGASFELQVPQLVVQSGEVVILRGMSGCGKSTLLDVLALALEPDGATVFAFGPQKQLPTDICRLWAAHGLDELGQLRGTHIGYVLQTGGLLPFLSARENIALPCRFLGQEHESRVETLARRLRITDQLEKLPAQLSVGERQRVAIARAMVHCPSVVLADEPTASVDPLNASDIMEMFLELVRHSGVTAVIATHDWQMDDVPGIQVLSHRIERNGEITRSLFWN